MVNLLELVLPVVGNVVDSEQSEFDYRCLEGEEINELGVKVATYGPWAHCKGSVQPVQRSRYEALGLDWAKNYISIWGSIVLTDLSTAKQPSQILWQGSLWNVTALTEWNPHNGWMNCTAVWDRRWTGEGGNVY